MLLPLLGFALFVAGVAYERHKHATPAGQAPASATIAVKPDSATTVPVGSIVAFDATQIPMILGRTLDTGTSDILEKTVTPYVFTASQKGMGKIVVSSSDGVKYQAYLNIV